MFSQESVSYSVHNRPHGYAVTSHPCYGAVGMHPTAFLCLFLLSLNNCAILEQNGSFMRIRPLGGISVVVGLIITFHSLEKAYR